MKPSPHDRARMKLLLRSRKKAWRAQAEASPLGRARRRKQQQFALALAVIVLLVLAGRCSCQKEIAEEKIHSDPTVRLGTSRPTPIATAGRHASSIPRREGEQGRVSRDTLSAPGVDSPLWLADFQRQLAARSPRLRACMAEVERPGALRWSAAMDLRSGQLTAPRFEEREGSEVLTASQRQCLSDALTSPPFHFDPKLLTSTHGSLVEIDHVLEF